MADPRSVLQEFGTELAESEQWGESAAGRSAVYVDLWEDYLEPVS